MDIFFLLFYLQAKDMWRISSLYNPSRSRLLSINTWVHSAAKERNASAFQKTQRLAYRHIQQLKAVTLSKQPTKSATELVSKPPTDKKAEDTKSSCNPSSDLSPIPDTIFCYAFTGGYCFGCLAAWIILY